MKAVIRKIARNVVKEEVPPYKYGVVTGLTLGADQCYVQLNSTGGTLICSVGGIARPTAIGQTVRVCGRPGDWYVSDILDSNYQSLMTTGGTTGGIIGGGGVGAINVLDVGAKGDVLVVSDAAIVAGTAALSRSGGTKFSTNDVGKCVQVVGAGVSYNQTGAWQANHSYAINDALTSGGITYVAFKATTSTDYFTTNQLAVPTNPNAATLYAKITDVNNGIATLDTNASTTVTGTTCCYGTDDSPVITSLASGRYYFPANRIFFLVDWYLSSETTIELGENVTFKIPYYGAATGPAVFRLMSKVTTTPSYIENIRFKGTVRFDFSEMSGGFGLQAKCIQIQNCRDFSFDDILGINVPGITGNVVVCGGNQAGYISHRGKFRAIVARGVRGLGSSCIQFQCGWDMDIALLVTDGGIAFRNEMDGQPGVADNIRIGLVHHQGLTAFQHSAASISAHANQSRNVSIQSILAENGADGFTLNYDQGTTGSVTDFTVYHMRVIGGGRAVNINGSDMVFPGGTIMNATVDSSTVNASRKVNSTLMGVGFAVAPGMRFYGCKASNCESYGFQDISWTGAFGLKPSQTKAEFVSCEGKSNLGGSGLYLSTLERVIVFGGSFTDDPNLANILTQQLLNSSQTSTTLSGWSAGGGASSAVGNAGVLTVVSDGSSSSVLAKTALGLSGIAVNEGSYYKLSAKAQLGTAAAGSRVNCTLWWYDSAGVAIGSQPFGSDYVVLGDSIANPAIAFYAQAPVGAFTVACLVKWFAPSQGATVPSGQSVKFSTFELDEVSGVPKQQYGIQAGPGVSVYYYDTDLRFNGVNGTGGAGNLYDRTIGAGGGSGASLTATTLQAFAGSISAPSLQANGINGLLSARLVGATASGPPTSGTFASQDMVIDAVGAIYICTAGGTPGTWVAVSGGGTAQTGQVKFYGNAGGVVNLLGLPYDGHDFTITQAVTDVNLPTNIAASGDFGISIVVHEDSTGGRTLNWPQSATGVLVWIGGSAPAINTGANQVNIINAFTYDGGAHWYGMPVASSGANVVYDQAQALSDSQAQQARINIRAAHRLSPTTLKTASYIASLGELVRCDASGSTSSGFPILLPVSAPSGARVTVEKLDATSNPIVITRQGTDTITIGATAGAIVTASTYSLSVQAGLDFVSDGAGNWTPANYPSSGGSGSTSSTLGWVPSDNNLLGGVADPTSFCNGQSLLAANGKYARKFRVKAGSPIGRYVFHCNQIGVGTLAGFYAAAYDGSGNLISNTATTDFGSSWLANGPILPVLGSAYTPAADQSLIVYLKAGTATGTGATMPRVAQGATTALSNIGLTSGASSGTTSGRYGIPANDWSGSTPPSTLGAIATNGDIPFFVGVQA